MFGAVAAATIASAMIDRLHIPIMFRLPIVLYLRTVISLTPCSASVTGTYLVPLCRGTATYSGVSNSVQLTSGSNWYLPSCLQSAGGQDIEPNGAIRLTLRRAPSPVSFFSPSVPQ